MVLGSHQFSRHANQHTHGSRTHRLGRRRLACATAPLWHRPIYRQWGISPRPETALASVAPVGFRASMPRVICGGGNALEMRPGQSGATITYPPIPKCCVFRGKAAKQQKGKATATTTFPIHPKVARLSRKARNSEGDTYPYRPRPFPPADLKAVNVGDPGRDGGFSPEHSAGRKEAPQRDAEPLCMSEDVPERSPRHAPGFPVGVLDLVGLSTYRRPADQR